MREGGKSQRMQMKVHKQQSITHNSQNDTWTTAEYDKSDQNTASAHNDTTSPRAIRLKATTSKLMYTKPMRSSYQRGHWIRMDPNEFFSL